MLPQELYTSAQTRELDRVAIERLGIPGDALMQRAGESAFHALRMLWPRAQSIAVVCGAGNNGGDAYVVARCAVLAGMRVRVMAAAPPRSETARAARSAAEKGGVRIEAAAGALDGAEVVVDGMFGTGLDRDLRDPWPEWVTRINDGRVPVLALDIPSGLNADTGAVMGAAVRAHATVSFIGLNLGLFTGAGREHAGRILYADLDLPRELSAAVQPAALRITARAALADLPPRARDAHKGSAGRVLVVGGERGMSGAARMAGEAAARVGAGLVIVATRAAHADVLNAGRPELMVRAAESAAELRELAGTADAIALGPGLGRGEWSRLAFAAALEAGPFMVVDADGLYHLAQEPLQRPDWVLTPHPGEAARLLGCRTEDVQADRPAAVREVVRRYGGICVLKGSGTLVAGEGPLALCDRGNPGLASGGTGDVLTGVIAGLRAQGLAAASAARGGVWLHASAGDRAARDGEAGTLATDLLPWIRLGRNGTDPCRS